MRNLSPLKYSSESPVDWEEPEPSTTGPGQEEPEPSTTGPEQEEPEALRRRTSQASATSDYFNRTGWTRRQRTTGAPTLIPLFHWNPTNTEGETVD